jgi:hypothetical protein
MIVQKFFRSLGPGVNHDQTFLEIAGFGQDHVNAGFVGIGQLPRHIYVIG